MADTVTILPASPTLTDFDSLDGIDDLDAFLDAKGSLSRFPTPPLKDKTFVSVVGVIEDVSEDESEDEVDELDIATIFARELAADSDPVWEDILAIEDLLLRAHMPIEVVALAFNILSKFLGEPAPAGGDVLAQPPASRLITATLSIASIFTSDHPPPSSYWATHVCQPPILAKDLDRIELEILKMLDWRLLHLASPEAIATALRRFERRRHTIETSHYGVDIVEPNTLDLDMAQHGEACWLDGQLTPALTPDQHTGSTWLRLN